MYPMYIHPHPNKVIPAAQVFRENLQTSGRWTGNQGQHVIGRKSVGRLKTSDGQRRVTTGAAGGGQQTKQQMEGEEEIGGEREYAQANRLGGKGTRANLGGGERRTRAII